MVLLWIVLENQKDFTLQVFRYSFLWLITHVSFWTDNHTFIICLETCSKIRKLKGKLNGTLTHQILGTIYCNWGKNLLSSHSGMARKKKNDPYEHFLTWLCYWWLRSRLGEGTIISWLLGRRDHSDGRTKYYHQAMQFPKAACSILVPNDRQS